MNNTVILCCGKAGCPELSIDDTSDTVTIKDDDDNVVTMQLSQAKLIGQAIDSLTTDKQTD